MLCWPTEDLRGPALPEHGQLSPQEQWQGYSQAASGLTPQLCSKAEHYDIPGPHLA